MQYAYFIFFVSCIVQLFFFLFFFIRLALHNAKKTQDIISSEPVSVIIAAHNELENLKNLLPALLAQKYNNFEILIADDRSTDGSEQYFKSMYKNEPKLKWIRIDQTPTGINSKKYALMQAISYSSYNILLFTDADCIPASSNWISMMASAINDHISLVLGYSPYKKTKGFLNQLIRYETFYTAVQYFSFALAGIPYMGVGRNLAYTKHLYGSHDGFQNHKHITGGDDDLFVRDHANFYNTTIVVHPDAHVYSIPKTNYYSWLQQKIRHVSVSIYYKPLLKFLLGLLYSSHILFYLSFTSVLILVDPFIYFLFAVRTLVFILIFVIIAKKISERFHWMVMLYADVFFVFNHMVVVMLSLLRRKKDKWI